MSSGLEGFVGVTGGNARKFRFTFSSVAFGPIRQLRELALIDIINRDSHNLGINGRTITSVEGHVIGTGL